MEKNKIIKALEIDRMFFKLVLEKDYVLRNEVYKKFKERGFQRSKKTKTQFQR